MGGGGKVLMLDYLKKRGWALANRCFFWEEEEENIDHILLHCPMVRGHHFCSLGVDWVRPHLLRDFLLGWKGVVWRKRPRRVVLVALLCLFG